MRIAQQDSGRPNRSPVRDRKQTLDSNQSPVRNRKQHSDSDQSPVRNRKQYSDSDQSPVRSRKQHSDSDQSPVRKQKQNSDSDQSPVKKRKQHSDSDRQRHKLNSSQISRRPRTRFDSSPNRDRHRENSKDKMKKTLSGAKAGLSSAKMLREETEIMQKKEKAVFDKVNLAFIQLDRMVIN